MKDVKEQGNEPAISGLIVKAVNHWTADPPFYEKKYYLIEVIRRLSIFYHRLLKFANKAIRVASLNVIIYYFH